MVAKEETLAAPWWRLLPLLIVIFIDLTGTGVLIPLAGFLIDSEAGLIGEEVSDLWRNIALGLIIALFSIGQFIGASVLGDVSDRIGRKKVIIFSLLGTAVANILFAVGVATGYLWLVLFSRALDGLTGGSVAVAITAIADLSTKKTKGRNFTLVGVAFMLGIVLGPLIGGRLSDNELVGWFSLSTPFLFLAGLATLNAGFVLTFFQETRKKIEPHAIRLLMSVHNVVAAMRDDRLRPVFLVIFLQAIALSLFIYFVPIYAVRAFEISQAQTADLTAYVALWVIVIQLTVAIPLSHRYLPEQILPISLLGSAISLLLVFAVFEFWMIYLFVPFMAAFESLTEPNNGTLLSNVAGEDEQGKALGIKQSMSSLGQGIAPIMGAMMLTFGAFLPLLTAAIITFVAWLIFQLGFKAESKQYYDELERRSQKNSLIENRE